MKTKNKVFIVSLSLEAYTVLKQLCFMSGLSVRQFAAEILIRFTQDPKKFFFLMNNPMRSADWAQLLDDHEV